MVTSFELLQLARKDNSDVDSRILSFLQSHFPALQIDKASINRNSKVSLNSLNGVCFSIRGEAYFFKFHTEEGETESLTFSEYYRAEELSRFGWPILKPIAYNSTPGSQCVIYRQFTCPTFFDVLSKVDREFLATRQYDESLRELVLSAETQYCRFVSEAFAASLETSDNRLVGGSLHQLFSHRLQSESSEPARLENFYYRRPITVSENTVLSFEQFSKLRWVINGKFFDHSIAEMIASARTLLAPETFANGASVIGHGDDHNGNKFLIDGKCILFDPAFAGRQPALLSFVKATVHNTLLHPFWFYEPDQIDPRFKISLNEKRNLIVIDHNWSIETVAPIRAEILNIYRTVVWQPLLNSLSRSNSLATNWREVLSSAFFCCPTLCLNLSDSERYPGIRPVLNFALSIELSFTELA